MVRYQCALSLYTIFKMNVLQHKIIKYLQLNDNNIQKQDENQTKHTLKMNILLAQTRFVKYREKKKQTHMCVCVSAQLNALSTVTIKHRKNK